jgi:hypothetical protein
MVLSTDVEPMARALLQSQGDARQAVYALVKEATAAPRFSSRPGDLIACAKAIVTVNEKLVEDALNGDAPAPAIALADDLDLDLSTEFDYGDVPAA